MNIDYSVKEELNEITASAGWLYYTFSNGFLTEKEVAKQKMENGYVSLHACAKILTTNRRQVRKVTGLDYRLLKCVKYISILENKKTRDRIRNNTN